MPETACELARPSSATELPDRLTGRLIGAYSWVPLRIPLLSPLLCQALSVTLPISAALGSPEPGGDCAKYWQCVGLRGGRARIEKSRFAQADDEAVVSHFDDDRVLGYLSGEPLLEFALDALQVVFHHCG